MLSRFAICNFSAVELVCWSLAIIGWVYTVLAAQFMADRQMAELPLPDDRL